MSAWARRAGGMAALGAAVYLTALVTVFFLMHASNEVAGKALALPAS